MAEKFNLKVVSGVSIAGVIHAPGAVALGVPEKLARQLLARGRVELATAEDVAAAAPKPEKKPKAAKGGEAEGATE